MRICLSPAECIKFDQKTVSQRRGTHTSCEELFRKILTARFVAHTPATQTNFSIFITILAKFRRKRKRKNVSSTVFLLFRKTRSFAKASGTVCFYQMVKQLDSPLVDEFENCVASTNGRCLVSVDFSARSGSKSSARANNKSTRRLDPSIASGAFSERNNDVPVSWSSLSRWYEYARVEQTPRASEIFGSDSILSRRSCISACLQLRSERE